MVSHMETEPHAQRFSQRRTYHTKSHHGTRGPACSSKMKLSHVVLSEVELYGLYFMGIIMEVTWK